MAIWQFVTDFLTATPTVSLDINSQTVGLMVADGYNLDPPKYLKGYAASSLRDGSTPVNSVAGNRILSIPIVVTTATRDLAATAIELLGQQIAVDNFLKVQFGSTPVFFRTFADPEYAWEVKKTLTHSSQITLELEAEPFAYGLRVNAGSFTVSNDPANGTNPCRFDVTGVTGDVPTPLFMLATSTGASGAPSGLVSKWTHVGMRRRGTPSGYSNLIQAEDMTQGTGAVVTADAAMSNGSKSLIGFGTPGLTLRLSDTFPGNGTATAEARGEYIVYGRFAKTVASDIVTVQLGYGASSTAPVMNDAKTLPAGAAGPYTVELGKVPVPPFSDPVSHGYAGGADLKVLLGFVGLYVARTAGSGSVAVDWLYFMPADDRTLISRFPATDVTYAIDGTTREGGSVYSINTALDTVQTIASPPQIVGGGGFPELIPGLTNRVHFLRHVDPTGTVDARTDTTTIQCYYWPRWREAVRP
jgi:hypothetical protein